MHKALIFFLAVGLILWIVMATPKEHFTNLMGVNWTSINDGTPPALYTDLPIKQPKTVAIAEAGVGNIQPSPPSPATLPSAPFSQRSKETPTPYRDPTNEPANYARILQVKEDLQAFFGFQAQMLETTSDPSIQIPLTRARADMKDLIDVQSVMERNPGLQSRITLKQLDDIQSNLGYLRAILHDLESSGAIQPQSIEAFTNPSPSETGPRATLKQLQEFQVKVVVETKRLEASGTTDPVIQGRLNTLQKIKDEVDQVIQQLQSGAITPETVPIFASDIEKSLPALGKPSDPLPRLLRTTGLPAAIANLFPGGLSSKDTEQAKQINNIVKGYMKNIFEGASWGVNVSLQYDNPNVLEARRQIAEAESKQTTGIPGVIPASLGPQPQGAEIQTNLVAPAIATQIQTDASYDLGLPGLANSRILPPPKSGHLDWKRRVDQIKEQVRRRGLDPKDFGALPDNAVVSQDYSWRGHAQMMCMRLNSTMDPGLATTVGCPSQDWPGWKD
jgi:hypothetical protein